VKFILTILSCFFFSPIICQIKTDDLRFFCNYYGAVAEEKIIFGKPAANEEQAIQDILNVVGLRPNFEVRSANVPNAAAVIRNNERYILYNGSFMKSINSAAKTNWAGISILAHEIGHHLNGHTLLQGGSRPDIELEADEFSGFILRKMGASLLDAQKAMQVAASAKASKTHPAKKDRIKSIAAGWQNADNQMKGKPATKESNPDIKKPVIVENPQKDITALDEKYIAYDIFFSSDASGKYFITTGNNLVKVQADQLYILGRLANSNKKKYALMIHDKEYNYLYVTVSGDIVNGNGLKVGRMKKH